MASLFVSLGVALVMAQQGWTSQDEGTPQAVVSVEVGDRKTAVVRLDHAPATDTAETIKAWLTSEQAATGQAAANVIADVMTNSLVVSGSLEQLRRIKEIVEQLDRRTPQIRVKAMLVELNLPDVPQSPAGHAAAAVSEGDIGEVVAKLQQRGQLRVLVQPQLLAADNQVASLQLGSRVPKVTGASVSARGLSNQVTLESVGTLLKVTGRVSENDLVTMQIDLERSHLGLESEGTPIATLKDGPVVRVPEVHTLTLQTTVSLRSGQTVLLGGMVYHTEAERWGEMLLLLQAEVIR